jgi:hypothetical protein
MQSRTIVVQTTRTLWHIQYALFTNASTDSSPDSVCNDVCVRIGFTRCPVTLPNQRTKLALQILRGRFAKNAHLVYWENYSKLKTAANAQHYDVFVDYEVYLMCLALCNIPSEQTMWWNAPHIPENASRDPYCLVKKNIVWMKHIEPCVCCNGSWTEFYNYAAPRLRNLFKRFLDMGTAPSTPQSVALDDGFVDLSPTSEDVKTAETAVIIDVHENLISTQV